MANAFPFADKLITDSQGNVVKVVLPIEDYQRLIDAYEDEGLLRAMNEVHDEPSLSLEKALIELDNQ